ncbi:MAG: TM1812 family CRISPR-associated protein [Campylobacterales bacterium]
MIISILGLAGRDKDKNPTKANYQPPKDEPDFIKEGEYHNSTDVMIKNFQDEKFIFLGTKDSENHQNGLIDFSKCKSSIEYFNPSDTKAIFDLMYKVLSNIDEPILFDITHGFRDTAIMSVLATVINRFTNKKNIEIVYAKEIEKYKVYEYEKVNYLLDISTLSYLLTTFLHTLNVPELEIKEELYEKMKNFSKNLFSNNIDTLLQTSYPELRDKIESYLQDDKIPIINLLTELKKELEIFDKIENKPEYMRNYYLAELMYRKNYHFAAYAYLFEAYPEYIYYHLQKRGFLEDTLLTYELGNDLKKMILAKPEVNTTVRDFSVRFTNKEFLADTEELFDRIRVYRNQMAHLNVGEDFDSTKSLESVLSGFKEIIIKDDPLSKLEEYATFKIKKIIDRDSDPEFRYLRRKFWQIYGFNGHNSKLINEIYSEIYFFMPYKNRHKIKTLKKEREFMEILDLLKKNDEKGLDVESYKRLMKKLQKVTNGKTS